MADTLSRIEAIDLAPEINLQELARLQSEDDELKLFLKSKKTSTQLQLMSWGTLSSPIYIETSTTNQQPYIPEQMRRAVVNMFHRLSHPGRKATLKIIKQRYFWPNMHK